MKRYFILAFFFLLILAIVPMVQGACVTPTENLLIVADTVFCPGTYRLNDSDTNGAIIINAPNIELDCNFSTLMGNNTWAPDSYGIVNNGRDGITIKNCIIEQYEYNIVLNLVDNANITNNVLRHTKTAIWVDNTETSSFSYNNFSNTSQYGIYTVYVLQTEGHNTYSYNNFNESTLGMDGINHTINNNVFTTPALYNVYTVTSSFNLTDNTYPYGTSIIKFDIGQSIATIDESSSVEHNVTTPNGGNIRFLYDGNKNFTVINNSIFLRNLQSPNNDIYNQTGNEFVAIDASDYNLTLNSGDEIIVGSYLYQLSTTRATYTINGTTGVIMSVLHLGSGVELLNTTSNNGIGVGLKVDGNWINGLNAIATQATLTKSNSTYLRFVHNDSQLSRQYNLTYEYEVIGNSLNIIYNLTRNGSATTIDGDIYWRTNFDFWTTGDWRYLPQTVAPFRNVQTFTDALSFYLNSIPARSMLTFFNNSFTFNIILKKPRPITDIAGESISLRWNTIWASEIPLTFQDEVLYLDAGQSHTQEFSLVMDDDLYRAKREAFNMNLVKNESFMGTWWNLYWPYNVEVTSNYYAEALRSQTAWLQYHGWFPAYGIFPTSGNWSTLSGSTTMTPNRFQGRLDTLSAEGYSTFIYMNFVELQSTNATTYYPNDIITNKTFEYTRGYWDASGTQFQTYRMGFENTAGWRKNITDTVDLLISTYNFDGLFVDQSDEAKPDYNCTTPTYNASSGPICAQSAAYHDLMKNISDTLHANGKLLMCNVDPQTAEFMSYCDAISSDTGAYNNRILQFTTGLNLPTHHLPNPHSVYDMTDIINESIEWGGYPGHRMNESSGLTNLMMYLSDFTSRSRLITYNDTIVEFDRGLTSQDDFSYVANESKVWYRLNDMSYVQHETLLTYTQYDDNLTDVLFMAPLDTCNLGVTASNYYTDTAVYLLNATAGSQAKSTTEGLMCFDTRGQMNVTVDSPSHLPIIYENIWVDQFNDTEDSACHQNGCAFNDNMTNQSYIHDEDWTTYGWENNTANWCLHTRKNKPQHIPDMQTASYNIRLWTSDGSCAGCSKPTEYSIRALVQDGTGANWDVLYSMNGSDYPDDTWHNLTLALNPGNINGTHYRTAVYCGPLPGTSEWRIAEDAIIVNPSYSLNATWDALTIFARNITGSVLQNFTVTVTDLNISMSQSVTTTGNNITFNLTGGNTYQLLFNKSDDYDFGLHNLTIGQGQNNYNFTIYHYPEITDCSLGVPSINFTVLAFNTSTLLNAEVDVFFSYSYIDRLGNIGYGNFSANNSLVNNTHYCINPNGSMVLSDVMVDYTYAGVLFSYNLDDVNLTNSTRHINLYITGGTTLVTFNVKNQNNDNVENAFITVQQWNTGTGTYTTTEILRTDNSGNALGNIVLYTAWYRFIITYGGVVYLTDGPTKVIDTTKYFRIDLGGASWLDTFDTYRNIRYNLSFTNSTLNFHFDWYDTASEISQACLNVIQANISGEYEIGTTCVSAYSGTTLINIAPVTDGTYIGTAYVIFPSGDEHVLDTLERSFDYGHQFYDDGNNYGVFVTFLMVLAMFFLFIAIPDLAIIGIVIGFIVMKLIGIYFIEWTYIIALVIMAALVIWRGNPRR